MELLIYCMKTTVREFKIIDFHPRRWTAEFSKTLTDSAYMQYTELLTLNVYPQTELGLNTLIRDLI